MLHESYMKCQIHILVRNDLTTLELLDLSLTKIVVWFITPACLYLKLELSLCELNCNGYVLYPFIRLNHTSIQRNNRKIFPLNKVLTTALLKLQSSGIWCPRGLETSTYTSPILCQTQQNPRYIHKPEVEKGLYTRRLTDHLQTLWWIQL
jgi:hypothetical protein